MSQPPLLRRRSRRFQYAASRNHNSSLMEVPRLSLDALSLARALVQAATDSFAQLRTRPRVETVVKGSGGVVATLLALKFAKSLRSACFVGLLAGVFAHSLYADVLRKKPVAVAAAIPRAIAVDSSENAKARRRSLADHAASEGQDTEMNPIQAGRRERV